MLQEVRNGTIRKMNEQERVYYDGYWIRYYDVPNSLAYKKSLIDQLTRRVFHHAEPGINTPGDKLDEVRQHYEAEGNSSRKRVLAAMLAGALLNRGADILTKVVELEQIGVAIEPDNELLKECGLCFMGALEHGRNTRVKHSREGLEELWGEPFKAFTSPVDQFLETRYIKIALAMREIDQLAGKMRTVFNRSPIFKASLSLIKALASSAKNTMETMRSDPAIIDIWPCFVSASEDVANCKPSLEHDASRREQLLGRRGIGIFHSCGALIEDLTNYRIPMPNTTRELLQRCDQFKERYAERLHAPADI